MRNLAAKIKRIVSWLPILWADRDWDHSFLLEIMAFKLRRMAVNQREDYAGSMREAAALCTRMAGEDYYPHPDPLFMPRLKPWLFKGTGEFSACYYEDYMYAQDLERLGLLFKKYLRCWWD